MAKEKIVVVTGLPGVGKTTALNALLELAQKREVKLQIVNYGTVMLEIASEMELSLHRDEVRRQPIELQRKLQLEAARRIALMAEGIDALVVDTHMIVKTSEGYWPGLPSYVLKELNPSLFILLEAHPSEIAERRTWDEARKRDRAAIEEVEEELAMARSFAAACSILTSAPIRVVMNPTGKQREAAEQILELILGLA